MRVTKPSKFGPAEPQPLTWQAAHPSEVNSLVLSSHQRRSNQVLPVTFTPGLLSLVQALEGSRHYSRSRQLKGRKKGDIYGQNLL